MIDVLKQALEELEYVLDCINAEKIPHDGDDFHETLRNLRQAIEQAEKQERNFCQRCGKRLGDGIHTCTPPEVEQNRSDCGHKEFRPLCQMCRAVGAQAQKQYPVAYLDAVDRRVVYVSPQRKQWLSEREDKEWRQFHYDHQHDTPLYTAPPQAEKQEPVTRKYSIEPHGNGYAIYYGRTLYHHGANIGHLTEVTPATIKLIQDALNAPPRKEWVGLNGEELAQLTIDNAGYPTRLTAAIEAKLKEKNA